MISTLALVLGIVLVAAWLTVMYIWWNMSRAKAPAPLKLEHIEHEFERITRLARRGWYASTLYGSKALDWVVHRAMNVFFKMFPKAKEAFIEHDNLAGLTQGPSSYFLMSISEKPKKVARKNIVS